MYYPMPKHGIDQVCIRRTPLYVLGTSGDPSCAQALVSPRMSSNKFPSPYAILKNIIIRSKYDASARHIMVHAIPYIYRAQSHIELVQKLYNKN